ncbi:MAG: acyl carrier protein [Anaerolineae bacterium]|nr:acyl carrier protein [Anaerolineae bacterium]
MDAATVSRKLKEYICRELICKADYPLQEDEPLITGGFIDSFSLAQIGVFIETEFGVYIPDVDLTVQKMDTLRQMTARVLEG